MYFHFISCLENKPWKIFWKDYPQCKDLYSDHCIKHNKQPTLHTAKLQLHKSHFPRLYVIMKITFCNQSVYILQLVRFVWFQLLANYLTSQIDRFNNSYFFIHRRKLNYYTEQLIWLRIVIFRIAFQDNHWVGSLRCRIFTVWWKHLYFCVLCVPTDGSQVLQHALDMAYGHAKYMSAGSR